MSGEAISSLLSRCGDSAGQDCKSPFIFHSLQEQFNLVRDFPEISNYLEFGQLSRLVLLEDEDKVKDFLEKYPSSINEINHLGQTPIHIAVQTQNATILRVLVNHADGRVLNTKDNNGHYAIDHATDALCHTRKPGKEPGLKVCNGCEVLNLLLHSDSAIFTRIAQRAMQLPWLHTTPGCIEGQKNIIRCLALRRKELRTLAQRELTPSERQILKFYQPGLLDQKAAQTQRFLEAKRCHVPTHLKVYDNPESPEDSKSIYMLISQGEVAEYALQSGFIMPMTLFDDIFRLLAEWLSSAGRFLGDGDFLFSSYISWLVDHGGDLYSTVPTLWGCTTAAHYFMTYLGMSRYSFENGNRIPLSPKVSSIIFEEDNVDGCRCQCSPKGCTPLSKFLAVRNRPQTWFHTFEIATIIRFVLEHLEYMCALLRHVGYDLTEEHWIDSAAVRHFTFLILDLRHTCCLLGNLDGEEARGPLSAEDCYEIEEEDSSRLELLEELVVEFGRERGNYADLISFVREYWAPRVEAVYREVDSYVLTETQVQSAEAFGVVWECYGPQLPPCDDILPVDTEEEEVLPRIPFPHDTIASSYISGSRESSFQQQSILLKQSASHLHSSATPDIAHVAFNITTASEPFLSSHSNKKRLCQRRARVEQPEAIIIMPREPPPWRGARIVIEGKKATLVSEEGAVIANTVGNLHGRGYFDANQHPKGEWITTSIRNRGTLIWDRETFGPQDIVEPSMHVHYSEESYDYGAPRRLLIGYSAYTLEPVLASIDLEVFYISEDLTYEDLCGLQLETISEGFLLESEVILHHSLTVPGNIRALKLLLLRKDWSKAFHGGDLTVEGAKDLAYQSSQSLYHGRAPVTLARIKPATTAQVPSHKKPYLQRSVIPDQPYGPENRQLHEVLPRARSHIWFKDPEGFVYKAPYMSNMRYPERLYHELAAFARAHSSDKFNATAMLFAVQLWYDIEDHPDKMLER
ncbi:hypothetical protein FGADI_11174, partial [Fusarium gaditjirri]